MAANVKNIIDFRGSLSPFALLKVTEAFGRIEVSDILEIRGINPDTRQDLFKVLPQASYELIEMHQVEDEGDLFRVKIRKCR